MFTIEPGMLRWWDGPPQERLWLARDSQGRDILRQQMGMHSRNVKVPPSCAIRDAKKGKAAGKLVIRVENLHEATLEVYSMDDPENPELMAEIEANTKQKLFCLYQGHELVVVNKDTQFEVATLFASAVEQKVTLRPTLGLNFLNSGPETIEVILLQETVERDLELQLRPG